MAEISKQIEPVSPRNKSIPLQIDAATNFSLKPTSSENTDILEKRLDAWKVVLKNLINYFEEISDVEQRAAKGLDHSATFLEIPIKEHQFFVDESEPGVQLLLNRVHSHTQSMADYYRSSSAAITDQTVMELTKLRDDVKRQSKEVKNEFSTLNSKLSKTRSSTNSQFKELAKVLKENQHEVVTDADHDPWIVNQNLNRQLHKDIKQENDYSRSIESSIDNLARFENQVVGSIKLILNNYYSWKTKDDSRAEQQAINIQELTSQIPDDVEWKKFSMNYPEAVPMSQRTVKTIDNIEKPFQEAEALATIRTGLMGRKSGVGIFKSWKEYFFVLTGSGFLHAFPTSDYIDKEPEFSIPLRKSVIGPYLGHDKDKDGVYCFEIIDKAAGGVFSSKKTYLLRADSKVDLDNWFNDISNYTQQSFVEKGSTVHSPPIVTSKAEVASTDANAEIPVQEHQNQKGQDEINPQEVQHVMPSGMMPGTTPSAAIATDGGIVANEHQEHLVSSEVMPTTTATILPPYETDSRPLESNQ